MGAAHTESDVDIRIITQIFKSQKNKRLIYNPNQPNPDGSKNIVWDNNDIDWSKHITGELLQGGNPAADGEASYGVVDLDRSKKTKSLFSDLSIDKKIKDEGITETEKVCMDVWQVDNKLIPFKSPSGAFHAYKFWHKPIPVKKASAVMKKLEHIFRRRKYNVDATHTLPTASGGQSGINYPFVKDKQKPYAPTGLPLTFNQFVHRYRFQHYPLIAAAAGMHDPGRHTALVKIAAILAKNNKMEYLDDVIKNFGTEFTDDGYIKRIKDKKIHEKYKNISAKGISSAISDITGFEYELPAADDGGEDYTPIKVYRMLDPNYQPQRRSFMLEGYLKKGCMTVIAGEPGVSKTQFLIQMAYSHISGYEFFNKKVNETGNALICTAEEERDEVELRVRACNKDREIKTGFHIDVVAVDTNLKLVKFSKDSDQKTKQFTELKDLIRENKYTFIGLDPLISLQAGAFDENNNPQMDSFCKNYLIPLAKEVGACLAVCHHTNKISMITDGGMIDNNALHAARGASSLIGAARIVIGLSPLTRQHWEKEFKRTKIVSEEDIKLMVGLIDAKNNYTALGSKPTWLKKEVVFVDCKDGQEAVAILTPTNISDLQDSRSKMSQEYARKEIAKHLPLIDQHMESTHGSSTKFECSLNKVATKLANLDPAIKNCNTTVDEKNLVFRYRTTLQTGLPQINPVKFNGFYYWYDYDNYASKVHHKLFKEDIESHDKPSIC